MPAEDVLAQRLRVQLLGLDVVPGKAVFRVRDQDPPVRGAFHGTEDARSRGCAGKADVEEAFEGAAVFAVDFGGFGEFVFAVGFFNAGEMFIEFEFGEGTPGD